MSLENLHRTFKREREAQTKTAALADTNKKLKGFITELQSWIWNNATPRPDEEAIPVEPAAIVPKIETLNRKDDRAPVPFRKDAAPVANLHTETEGHDSSAKPQPLASSDPATPPPPPRPPAPPPPPPPPPPSGTSKSNIATETATRGGSATSDLRESSSAPNTKPAGSSFLESIRNREVKLKPKDERKVSEERPQTPAPGSSEEIAGKLAAALAARRGAIGDGKDDEDAEWDFGRAPRRKKGTKGTTKARPFL